MDIHRSTCPQIGEEEIPSLQVSCDGVTETKSTTVTLDVYSSRTTKCKIPYVHKFVRPLGKFKLDNRRHLNEFLIDVKSVGRVCQFIGDNPKRALARECKHHSSNFAYKYCFAKATRQTINTSDNANQKHDIQLQQKLITDKLAIGVDNEIERRALETLLDNLITEDRSLRKGASHPVWPARSANGEERTTEKVLEIIDKLESSEEPLSPGELKGIMGRSLFLDIAGFDFVKDIPVDIFMQFALV